MNVQAQRAYVRKHLLIDRCRIYPQALSTVSDEGLPVLIPPEPLLYEGSPDIPCRLDTQRTVFNDKYKEEALTATGFTLDLPIDLEIKESYIVHIRNRPFMIKRLYNEGAKAVVKEALIVTIEET